MNVPVPVPVPVPGSRGLTVFSGTGATKVHALSDLVTQNSQKLRTLHVNTQSTWRGGEQQTLYLLEGLRRRGHEVVLATRPDSPLARRARDAELDVLPIRPINEGDPFVALQLVRWMRRRRPHLVHVHASHAHLLVWLASLLVPRIPVVVTRRVDLTIYRPWTMRINALKYRCRIAHFIAVSRAVHDRLLDDGVSGERVTVVPSGVDPTVDASPESSACALRKEWGLPGELPVILSAGALVVPKGYAGLVEAASRVLQSVDASFVIAGAGRERDSLYRQVERLGLTGRVRLVGFRQDVHTLLRAADIYVQPSLQEALGTSILDAMFFGVPVVASRVGGVPELIDDGVHGILVPPGDAALLSDVLVALLSSKERRNALARAARERVRTEFGVDRMVEGNLDVYRRVLGA